MTWPGIQADRRGLGQHARELTARAAAERARGRVRIVDDEHAAQAHEARQPAHLGSGQRPGIDVARPDHERLGLQRRLIGRHFGGDQARRRAGASHELPRPAPGARAAHAERRVIARAQQARVKGTAVAERGGARRPE